MAGKSSYGHNNGVGTDAGASHKLSDGMNRESGNTENGESGSVNTRLPDNCHGGEYVHYTGGFLPGPDTTAQAATNSNGVNRSAATPNQSHIEQQHDKISNSTLVTSSISSSPPPPPPPSPHPVSSAPSGPYDNNPHARQTTLHGISMSTIAEVSSRSTSTASIPAMSPRNPNPFSFLPVTTRAVQDSQTRMQTPPPTPSQATTDEVPPPIPVLIPAVRRAAAEGTQQQAQFGEDREGYQLGLLSRAVTFLGASPETHAPATPAPTAMTCTEQRRQAAGGGNNGASTYHQQVQQQQRQQEQQSLPPAHLFDVEAAVPYFEHPQVHYQQHHSEREQQYRQAASAIYAAYHPSDSRRRQSRRTCAQCTPRSLMKWWVLLSIMILFTWLILGLAWLAVTLRNRTAKPKGGAGIE